MKKFISVALAVLLVAMACPLTMLTAFAASTGTVVIKDAEGNTPEAAAAITDINSAFDWVYSQTNSADYTIYLNGDVTTDTMLVPKTYDHNDVKTVRINGNNHTLTSTNGTSTFYGTSFYNLKLTDIDLVWNANQAAALDWSPRLTTSDDYAKYKPDGDNPVVDTYAEFTNVTGRSADGKAAVITFKLKGGGDSWVNTGTFHITLTDCEFYHNGADTMFMMNNVGHLDLDVIGTKLMYEGGSTSVDGNNYIFALNGGKADINVANSENNTSVIDSNSTSTRVTSGIFNNGTNYDVDVTLGKDVEIRLGANDVKTSAKFFYADKTTTEITDNGAKWIVKSNLLDNGAAVTLPTFYDDNGVPHIWQVNGEGDAIANPYVNASATADITVTHKADPDPESNPHNVAYIELADGTKTYYTSLQYAVNALGNIYAAVTTENLTDAALWTAAGSPVIKIYKDITISSTIVPSWWSSGYDINRVRTVVIEGAKDDNSNVVINSTVEGGAIQYNSYYNLTMKNIDLNCPNGFALFWSGYHGAKNSGKSTTNMINCNISANGTAGEGLVFKVTGNQNQTKTENYIINMVNTKVTATDGVNAVFLFHHGAAGELNIDGTSEITQINNSAKAGGDTMFMLGTNRTFEINVASGAKLTATAKNSSADMYSIFRTEKSHDYEATDGSAKNIINIASGAKLTINADEAFTKPVAFIWQLTPADMGGAVVNMENGVEFAVNAKAAALGFEIINGDFTSDDDSLLVGWKGTVGEETVEYATDAFEAGAITGAATFVPLIINQSSIAMMNGAGLKTEGTLGVSFGMTISDELLAIVGENATYGILIAPSEYVLTDLNRIDLLTGQFIDLSTDAAGLTDGDGAKSCILGIKDFPAGDGVFLELSARGYVTYEKNGSTVIYYTSETIEVSLYELAEIAAANGYADNANVKTILDLAK